MHDIWQFLEPDKIIRQASLGPLCICYYFGILGTLLWVSQNASPHWAGAPNNGFPLITLKTLLGYPELTFRTLEKYSKWR